MSVSGRSDKTMPSGVMLAAMWRRVLSGVLMLGNLLDNACKWARSRVQIDIEHMNDRLLILVEDDGPGIPEPQRADVLRRG